MAETINQTAPPALFNIENDIWNLFRIRENQVQIILDSLCQLQEKELDNVNQILCLFMHKKSIEQISLLDVAFARLKARQEIIEVLSVIYIKAA